MGRLSGFSYREVVQKLRVFGSQFDRQAPGSQEIWRQAQAGRKVIMPVTVAPWLRERYEQSFKKPASTQMSF
jgi:hypothetical protein